MSAPSCSPCLSDRGAWWFLMALSPSAQLSLLSEKAQKQSKHPGLTQAHSWDAAGEQRVSRPARSTPAPWPHQWSSAHSTRAALSACTAGKRMSACHPHPQPCLSLTLSFLLHWRSSHKNQQTPCFVLPHVSPHQGWQQETWPGFSKDGAGLVGLHATHHCPVLPCTCTWCCLSSYMDNTRTGGRTVGKDHIKSWFVGRFYYFGPARTHLWWREDRNPSSLTEISRLCVHKDLESAGTGVNAKSLMSISVIWCLQSATAHPWATTPWDTTLHGRKNVGLTTSVTDKSLPVHRCLPESCLLGSCWAGFTPSLQRAWLSCSAARTANCLVGVKESVPGWWWKSIRVIGGSSAWKEHANGPSCEKSVFSSASSTLKHWEKSLSCGI